MPPKNFLEISKNRLTFSELCVNISKSPRGEQKIRVWRSLVSRLNGVQEASSSNLDTRTKKTENFGFQSFFFVSVVFPFLFLTISSIDISFFIQYNILRIGVWRSLVSRLVRVQEASGSNPDTPTKKFGDHKCGHRFSIYIYFLTQEA